MSEMCPRCQQGISQDDTVQVHGDRVAHLDCRRPRDLSHEERAILFRHCFGHAVATCPVCAESFREHQTRRGPPQPPRASVPPLSRGPDRKCSGPSLQLRDAPGGNAPEGAGSARRCAKARQTQLGIAGQCGRPDARGRSSSRCAPRDHSMDGLAQLTRASAQSFSSYRVSSRSLRRANHSRAVRSSGNSSRGDGRPPAGRFAQC